MDFNFHFQNYQRLASTDPEAYFINGDTGLYIRIDHFISKHYRFEHKDLVEDIVYRYSSNKPIYFEFYDGGNPRLSGFTDFIQHISQQYRLPKEQIIVITYQTVDIPEATVIHSSISQFLSGTYNYLSDIELLDNQFTKNFGCLLGRHDLFRLRLIKHMYSNYREQSVLSCYTTPRSIQHLDHPKLKSFYPEYDWAVEHLPIRLENFNTTQWGSVNWYEAVQTSATIYKDFFIDIVTETDCNSSEWFTEKTYKTFMLGRPFLLWSGAGALRTLQNLGFQTFNSVFDESYDLEQCNQKRFQKLLTEIDRLATLTVQQCQAIHIKLKPVFEHNRVRMQELKQQMDIQPWKFYKII